MSKLNKLAFKKWRKENLEKYREYLIEITKGDRYNLETTEDYWDWTEEEYRQEMRDKEHTEECEKDLRELKEDNVSGILN